MKTVVTVVKLYLFCTTYRLRFKHLRMWWYLDLFHYTHDQTSKSWLLFRGKLKRSGCNTTQWVTLLCIIFSWQFQATWNRRCSIAGTVSITRGDLEFRRSSKQKEVILNNCLERVPYWNGTSLSEFQIHLEWRRRCSFRLLLQSIAIIRPLS